MSDDSLLSNTERQSSRHWVDIQEFPDLIERLGAFDARLRVLLTALSDRTWDPDLLLEDIADLVGDGLHRCQLYMRQRIELSPLRLRLRALRHGPRLGGRYLADVVWAGANYWKHQAEWPDEECELDDRQRDTLRVFRDVGVTGSEHWLAQLLSILTPNQTALSPVADQLVIWREELDREMHSMPVPPERRRRTRGQPKTSAHGDR